MTHILCDLRDVTRWLAYEAYINALSAEWTLHAPSSPTYFADIEHNKKATLMEAKRVYKEHFKQQQEMALWRKAFGGKSVTYKAVAEIVDPSSPTSGVK